MTEQCDACGDAVEKTSLFDIFNESGAATAQICPDCEQKLHDLRCRACGERVSRHRDEAIAPHGVAKTTGRVCPGCRRDILFGEGGVFQ